MVVVVMVEELVRGVIDVNLVGEVFVDDGAEELWEDKGSGNVCEGRVETVAAVVGVIVEVAEVVVLALEREAW